MTDAERKAFIMSPETIAERLRAPWVWRSGGVVRGSYWLYPERETKSVEDPMFHITTTPLVCAHLVAGGHGARLGVLPEAMPLIAAAPDLLEAAQQVIDSTDGFDMAPTLSSIEALRAAVAKATTKVARDD